MLTNGKNGRPAEKSSARVAAVVLVIGVIGASVAGAVAADVPRPLDALDAALWAPVEDPGRGRLNEGLLRLLVVARTLAVEKDMRLRVRDIARQEQEREEQERKRLAAARPVVELDELAYAHMKAGQYEQAADIYLQILEMRPGERHAMVMRALCLRRAGRPREAAEVMDELRRLEDAKDDDLRGADWIRWADSMKESSGSDE